MPPIQVADATIAAPGALMGTENQLVERHFSRIDRNMIVQRDLQENVLQTDLYTLMGVSTAEKDARECSAISREQLGAMYRKTIIKYHPDKVTDDRDKGRAEKMYAWTVIAKDILTNVNARS